jgi:HK97 family phage portal protein
MSDEKFDKAVEQAVSNRLDGFAETLNKQMSDAIGKDYANTWLKANELMLGGSGNDLTKPAQHSYLVYKCVTVIANNFPQAPFVLYGSDDQPLDKSTPLYQLLQNPNDTMSGFDLWSSTSTFYNLYGEAYWYLVESVGQSMGTTRLPAEIVILDPKRMVEVVSPDTGLLLGWMYDSRISLTLDEVIQFKNTNPYNRYRGLSPLDAVNIEVKSDYKASVYQKKFFDNDAKPGMVLQVDKDDNSTLEELKKLVRIWEQGHKGADNAHKTGVLRGGMTLKPIGLTQQEMDFINSRSFTRDIVLSVFGVPKTLAGFTEGINRATADTQKRIFWQETLKPQMLRMQERLNAKLVYSAMPGAYGKFDFSRIDELKQSMDEDVKNANVLFGMGFSRNELNQRFHLGFDEDPNGDVKYVPMNLIDVEATAPEPEPQKQFKEEVVKKDEKVARMTRQRQIFLKKQAKNERILLGKVKKYFITQRTKVLKGLYQRKDVSTSELVSRINIIEKEDERLIAQLTPIFQSIMEDAGQMALDFINVETDYQLDRKVLFDRVNRVKDINKTVFNQLKIEIAEGVEAGETIDDISKRIKKVYKFADKRATTIARTESSALMSETSLEVYKSNGVQKKEWLTAGDGNVRPEHMGNEGQGPIPVNRPFQNGEMFPGQNSINCRCSISPVVSL